MDALRFRKWLGQLALLTRRQREQLFSNLRPALGLDRACAVIEQTRSALCCPGCGSLRRHRHGFDRGIQRYRCCACRRTYSALTGTPLARLRHRAKWLDYLEGIEAVAMDMNTTMDLEVRQQCPNTEVVHDCFT